MPCHMLLSLKVKDPSGLSRCDSSNRWDAAAICIVLDVFSLRDALSFSHFEYTGRLSGGDEPHISHKVSVK